MMEKQNGNNTSSSRIPDVSVTERSGDSAYLNFDRVAFLP